MKKIVLMMLVFLFGVFLSFGFVSGFSYEEFNGPCLTNDENVSTQPTFLPPSSCEDVYPLLSGENYFETVDCEKYCSDSSILSEPSIDKRFFCEDGTLLTPHADFGCCCVEKNCFDLDSGIEGEDIIPIEVPSNILNEQDIGNWVQLTEGEDFGCYQISQTVCSDCPVELLITGDVITGLDVAEVCEKKTIEAKGEDNEIKKFDTKETCETDLSGTYPIFDYSLNLNFNNLKYYGTHNYGVLTLDLKSEILLSKNIDESGKVTTSGNFVLTGVNYRVLDGMKETMDKRFFGKFTIQPANDGKPIDIMKELFDPILEKTGETTGIVEISTQPIDKHNKLFNILLKGNMLQKYTFSSNKDRKYNKVLGPFKREQIKELKEMFDNAIGKAVEWTVKDTEAALSDGKTESERGNIYKKEEYATGKTYWGESQEKDKADVVVGYSQMVVELFKDGKVSFKEVSTKNIHKAVIYTPSKISIDKLLETSEPVKKEESDGKTEQKTKTKSQSVWILRTDFNRIGLAYHFYPLFNFSKEINLSFEGDDESYPLYFDDLILDDCFYDVLDSVKKNIGYTGGEINLEGNAIQTFPYGSVPKETEFNIKLINITSCGHCMNFIQDGDEIGIDCGGSCKTCTISCSDNIQNQNEIGIDCGGNCVLDINESCGYDFNRDCNIIGCEKIEENCTSDFECLCNIVEEKTGYCINNSCACKIELSDFPIVVRSWEDNEFNLLETLKYSKLWASPLWEF